MKAIFLVLAALVAPTAAWCAGAMGHNALGSITADRILNGTYPAPPELREALKQSRVRQAFLGGAVGPDLFPDKTHRGNPSQVTQRMIDDAWREYRAAGNDPSARAKASESLAFAYGWLTHVAVDLNVHPKVNSIVGDTYDHNNAAQKTKHAALEAQLYAYLKRVAGVNQAYDAKFPSDFVCKELGVDSGALARAAAKLRLTASAEIAASNQVTLTDSQLKDAWTKAVRDGMADSRTFIENSKSFENWDLDCGKISTDEFEWLRKTLMQLNGGKLPADWGKRYLEYWGSVKGLSPGDRAAKLAAMFGKSVAPEKTTSSGVPALAKSLAGQPMNLTVRVGQDWVYPTRLHYPDATIRWEGSNFSLRLNFDESPFRKDIKIDGQMADGEIAWIKLEYTATMIDRPEYVIRNYLEAKHIPEIPGGLLDDYVGDVTFAAVSDRQARTFTGSFKDSSGSTHIWDKTTMPELSKVRTRYPILTIRFRLKKYG